MLEAETRPDLKNKVKGSDEFQTPPGFYSEVNREFRFNYDGAATAKNSKTKLFARDFLTEGIPDHLARMRVWINPPYGNIARDKWVPKAYAESLKWHLVVMLLPVATDTSYWHDVIAKHASEIRFIKGRVKFWINGAPSADVGTFASALIVFRPPAKPSPLSSMLGHIRPKALEILGITVSKQPLIRFIDFYNQMELF